MKNQIKLAPSILSCDFTRLGEQISLVEDHIEMIHIDVMDGHFVPNITIGPLVVSSLKKYTKLPLDVHLMIENPGEFIEMFAQAGCEYISVHIEACRHLHRVIKQIKEHRIKTGIALNPATPLTLLYPILFDIDFVLIMSVNPGFGGQEFIQSSLRKIREARAMAKKNKLEIDIEVDGGITAKNAKNVISAGANIIVAGEAIFNQPDIKKAALKIKRAIQG